MSIPKIGQEMLLVGKAHTVRVEVTRVGCKYFTVAERESMWRTLEFRISDRRAREPHLGWQIAESERERHDKVECQLIKRYIYGKFERSPKITLDVLREIKKLLDES